MRFRLRSTLSSYVGSVQFRFVSAHSPYWLFPLNVPLRSLGLLVAVSGMDLDRSDVVTSSDAHH